MPPSKSPRNAVKEGLKRLMRLRIDQEGPLFQVFPYEPMKSIYGKRDPKDDRTAAILGTAVLEQALEHAISCHFKRDASEIRDQLFDGDAAVLRELATKISMAYMLGIIGPETRSDLALIRQIRNVFAHSRAALDFDTPELSDACMALTLYTRTEQLKEPSRTALDPRERFIQTMFEYSLWLFTDDQRKSEGGWNVQALRS